MPISVPQNVLDQLKNRIKKLKDGVAEADKIISEFFAHNPTLLNYIKAAAIGAGVAIIVGTIVEDILTGGVGILDDWASFALAYRIIRFALA